MLFVTFRSLRAYTYEPSATLQCLLNSRWRAVTIYLVKYLIDIKIPYVSALNYIITKYNMLMMIYNGRQ